MAEQNDWWRGSVTYQIYPRSFMDSNGDGIGDLNGITEKLGYVADLGVDAIWLSPVFTSPMKDMGYDVSNYTDIDPTFGTLKDFDKLTTRAHDLGLKVIIDQVLSHSSDQHDYFVESRSSRNNPKSDWYVWHDPKPDGMPPNNWRAIFGGSAWEWDTRRKQYYFHNFLKEQPDWNLHNPDVQNYLLKTMKFWLDRGVDGFRLDTVNFYFHDKLLRDNPANPLPWAQEAAKPYDMQYCLFSKNQPENLVFLERLRALLDKYDARTTVGEVGDTHHSIELMGQYTSGKKLHMAYSFEMLGPNFSADHFRSRIVAFYKGAPEGWPCWAFSNHDVPRHVGRWLEHAKDQDTLAKLSAAMLLTFEGSVCLYQGEELGQVDTELSFDELTDPEGINFWPEVKGRDGCRTPMAWQATAPSAGFSQANQTWLPVKSPQAERAASTQSDATSVLSFYKEMLALRKATPELVGGEIAFLDLPEPVLGYTRGGAVTCVFNLGMKPVTVPIKAPNAVLISQGAELTAKGVELQGTGFLIAK
ncbi:MAG: alpha-amylase family glycosyl hydrolase [Pseudomonadota bacterium]